MVTKWRVPTGMTSLIHEFDAREGGSFRISLTYEAPNRIGKTAAQTDTYHGHFARLVPDEQVVEVLEFESLKPTAKRVAASRALPRTFDEEGLTVVIMAGARDRRRRKPPPKMPARHGCDCRGGGICSNICAATTCTRDEDRLSTDV
jgi:hypothetical protein